MEELTTTPCAGRQNLEYLQHEDFSLKTGCWKETDCFLALSALKTRLYGKTNEWMNKLIDVPTLDWKFRGFYNAKTSP
ncbi:uncharacterized protein LOC144924752 isoform X4 [Branchiostoma floridae x Branchiostoma belcheri]